MTHHSKIAILVLLGLTSISHAYSSYKPCMSRSLNRSIQSSNISNKPKFPASIEIIQQRKFQLALSSSESAQQEKKLDDNSIRSVLRGLTGFSLTAFRLSIRATAATMRTTLRTATGVSITGMMSAFVGIFPLWIRSFFQPFLILYYTPLMILRSLVGTTSTSNQEARQTHEHFVEGWKKAIEVAEKVNEDGYWPIHINENGGIEFNGLPDPKDIVNTNDLANAIVDSVEVALEAENEN